MQRPTNADLGQLRKHFDSNEPFMNYGANVVKVRSQVERKYETPLWMHSDIELRNFLQKYFPKQQTNPRQRTQAGRWALVILHYFRMGRTDSQIEFDMAWKRGAVGSLVQQIRHAIAGLRLDGKQRSSRPRGRPKRQKPQNLENVHNDELKSKTENVHNRHGSIEQGTHIPGASTPTGYPAELVT
jgi:hypothetical protein